MGLLCDCKELFDSDNLYVVLGLTKDATENQVKKAYHKLSLKVHPDRVEAGEKEHATRSFQTLGQVYSILSDEDRKSVYDETGEVDDENNVTQDRDWNDYWRLLFMKVSVKDIQEFEEQYKGSTEELSDLQTCYMDCQGDLGEIIDSMLCATVDDEDRFTDILKGLIKEKTLPDFDKFSKEKKSKRKARRKMADDEAAEAEELKKELGLDADDSLKAMIMKKQSSRKKDSDDFFAHLEEKYAQPKKKGKKT